MYDPNESKGWPNAATKYADPEIFFRNIERVRSAIVYVDEAKTLWDYDAERADKLAYAGRHQGFAVVLIAQRTKMVAPNGRNQCSRIFAFRQQRDDALTLASEYHEGMEECRNLPPYHFLASNGFEIWRGHVTPTEICWDTQTPA